MNLDDPPPNAKILRAYFFALPTPEIPSVDSTLDILTVDYSFILFKEYYVEQICDYPMCGFSLMNNE